MFGYSLWMTMMSYWSLGCYFFAPWMKVFDQKNNEEWITKTMHSFIAPSNVVHKEQMLNEVFTLSNFRHLIAMLVLGTVLSIFK